MNVQLYVFGFKTAGPSLEMKRATTYRTHLWNTVDENVSNVCRAAAFPRVHETFGARFLNLSMRLTSV